MSAAEHSVLPTSVLAPKTMAVRRAAICERFSPLPSVVPQLMRPLRGGLLGVLWPQMCSFDSYRDVCSDALLNTLFLPRAAPLLFFDARPC